ncbi:hypothetical protein DAPPUDRAFT_213444 [Daphnia pulex]|uniref:BTB domain-containing protein n=1 Tax=Daphnia pulex TaxID=6669 RepID=E9GSU5_DAPPU|nr:hypothetical protein DAPPUDRAFT_213444 [Daphnia pulex]|eukprot:EFX77491.1 hypothetical protein DAPPUDRAFT_213444 [Daphnia pulex]
MFNHDMQESKTGQVVITDIKRDVFYQLLHYLYSGRTSTLMTQDIANPLYAAAHKYSLEDLQKECEECVRMLLSDIQVSNVVGMLIWSHVHSVEEVKNAALDVVAKNGKTVCLSIDYKKMMRTHPDLCLEATRHMWP